ncbi:MAG: hypothetical protein IKP45_00050 [Bacteroidales bacterium]|nr:hypothetical protein [Bacteroidales bacterium]
MKRLIVILVFLSVIVGGIFVSCEKEETEAKVDYRLKWVGTYNCQKEGELDYPEGRISTACLHITAVSDSLLNIKEEVDSVPLGDENRYLNLKVRANPYGEMWGYSNNVKYGPMYFRANFYGDSIYAESATLFGPNSGWHSIIYKGQKIKKTNEN